MDPSVLQKSVVRFGVELHPSKGDAVLEGVQEQLNSQLLRYMDELQGVVLAYSNIRILTNKPLIHPYFPYFHLDVQADVLLFRPVPGCQLVGRVTHVGGDFIGLLVLGVFNASIPRDKIRTDLKLNEGDAAWVSRGDRCHRIAVDSEVLFSVDVAQDYAGYFGIRGSLQTAATGAIDCASVRAAAGLAPLAAAALASPAAGKKDKGGKSDKDQEKSERKKEKSETKDKKRKAEGEAVDGPSTSGRQAEPVTHGSHAQPSAAVTAVADGDADIKAIKKDKKRKAKEVAAAAAASHQALGSSTAPQQDGVSAAAAAAAAAAAGPNGAAGLANSLHASSRRTEVKVKVKKEKGRDKHRDKEVSGEDTAAAAGGAGPSGVHGAAAAAAAAATAVHAAGANGVAAASTVEVKQEKKDRKEKMDKDRSKDRDKSEKKDKDKSEKKRSREDGEGEGSGKRTKA